MNTRIKDFIESNIIDIESNNWKNIFLLLINSSEDVARDNQWVYHVLEVFDNANIDYYSDFSNLGIEDKEQLKYILAILAIIINGGIIKNNIIAASKDFRRYFLKDEYIRSEEELKQIARLAKILDFEVYTINQKVLEAPNFILIEPTYSIRNFLIDIFNSSSVPTALRYLKEKDIEKVDMI